MQLHLPAVYFVHKQIMLWLVSLSYYAFSQVKVLNDAKETAVILYVSSIILAGVIVVTIAFSTRIGLYSGMYSLGIPLTCIIILAVVFLSKVVNINVL